MYLSIGQRFKKLGGGIVYCMILVAKRKMAENEIERKKKLYGYKLGGEE